MVKKKNARQRREEEKNRIKAIIEKIKNKVVEKDEAEEIVENNETKNVESIVVEPKKKSLAKASGVKSVFINNDEIIMT